MLTQQENSVHVLFSLHQGNSEQTSSNVLGNIFALLAMYVIVCLVNEVLVTEDLASAISC